MREKRFIMDKPIIGIVSKHYSTYKSNKIDIFIRDEIKQAIFDNGGIAIGILPTEFNINYCGDDWKDNLSKFYIGVRFHPESLYKKDKKMNMIFKGFINACRD